MGTLKSISSTFQTSLQVDRTFGCAVIMLLLLPLPCLPLLFSEDYETDLLYPPATEREESFMVSIKQQY